MASTLANRQYGKIESQWFVEPAWAVEALLDVERFSGEVTTQRPVAAQFPASYVVGVVNRVGQGVS